MLLTSSGSFIVVGVGLASGLEVVLLGREEDVSAGKGSMIALSRAGGERWGSVERV